MIRKAVIPAAGLGTRLLPATKETPKEMLPLFVRTENGVVLKPLLQIIYEQLYIAGIREFCVVTGRAKRAIEDHFTPDDNCLEGLLRRNLTSKVKELGDFYGKLENSMLMWVNQPRPKGFGDAVNRARSFVGSEPFIVHAGDTYIHSDEGESAIVNRLATITEKLQPDAAFLVKKVKDPTQYGIVELLSAVEKGVYEVKRVEEKPVSPTSDLAIVPVYLFTPTIHRALDDIGIGRGGETQLTDAIQRLIEKGKSVFAVELDNASYIDIGKAESYFEAMQLSYNSIPT